MPLLFKVLVLTLILAHSCYALAAGLELSPVNRLQAAKSDVLNRVSKANFSNVVLFTDQTFRLNYDGAFIGTIVNGRGLLTTDGRENASCFVALSRPGGSTELVVTIGRGPWEAESCIEVKAVGIVANHGRPSIGIVYEAASPNSAVLEPLVLNWNRKSRQLEIDEQASQKASIAGATTLLDVRRALK